jgi:hypothetical protein
MNWPEDATIRGRCRMTSLDDGRAPKIFRNCETFASLEDLIGADLLRSGRERLCDLSKADFAPATQSFVTNIAWLKASLAGPVNPQGADSCPSDCYSLGCSQFLL